MGKEYFAGRKLVIATMHRKQQVLQPLLEEALGVECILPKIFNSDLLGTFSGEVEREWNPLDVAIKKCEAAMLETNTTLAVASEGSFGPHPYIGFIPADEELLVLVDKQYELIIKVKELSTATNFGGRVIYSKEDALAFAESVLFPSHALIVKKAKNNFTDIYKGIHDRENYLQIVSNFLTENGSAYVETDMRANFNPSRMLVIGEACKKLIAAIKHSCKNCGIPGFSITEVIGGLPCTVCGTPTRSTKAVIYTCEKCNYKEKVDYPNNKITEDPMYCDICNP